MPANGLAGGCAWEGPKGEAATASCRGPAHHPYLTIAS
jgi:hypothetical protein